MSFPPLWVGWDVPRHDRSLRGACPQRAVGGCGATPAIAPRPWGGGRVRASRLAPASPQSSLWPAPPRLGACCCPGAGLRLASHGVEPASLIEGCLEGPRRTRGVHATRGWNGRGGASLVEAAGGGGLTWRRKRLPLTGQTGQDSRRDGKRSVCGRIGCMARSSARTAGSSARTVGSSVSLISPESAVRPGLARLDASSRVAAVGCSGALTAESGEDLG